MTQSAQHHQQHDRTNNDCANNSQTAGGESAAVRVSNNGANEEHGLDQVLVELGSTGRFQMMIFVLLLVPVVLFSMYEMTYLFTTGRLDYRYLTSPEKSFNGSLQFMHDEHYEPHSAESYPKGLCDICSWKECTIGMSEIRQHTKTPNLLSLTVLKALPCLTMRHATHTTHTHKKTRHEITCWTLRHIIVLSRSASLVESALANELVSPI